MNFGCCGCFVFSGPSTVACAETLRQEGFKGRIVLVSRESDLPYDRPKLSKVCMCVCVSCVYVIVKRETEIFPRICYLSVPTGDALDCCFHCIETR